MKLISPTNSLRFPISNGYLGLRCENTTLNAMFFSEVLNTPNLLKNSIIFPQRVLKKDFFNELLFLESQEFKSKFISTKNKLLQEMFSVLKNLENKERNYYFLNYLQLLLRYGLFETIIKLNSNFLSGKLSKNDFYEFLLIKEIAKNRLSSEPVASAKFLKTLCDFVLKSNKIESRLRVLILTYTIVFKYRHKGTLDYNSILKYKNCLLEIFEKNDNEDNFSEIIRKSVCYRGLSMIKELSFEDQKTYLESAERLARSAMPSGILEEIIKKENLLTCLQSYAKWNIQCEDSNLAELNLNEMIKLDPYDSTSYGEMGFLQMNIENYQKAASFFEVASILGPPAKAMHTYYHAKCLQVLGNGKMAELKFKEVVKLDPFAVSPLIDLIEYNMSLNNKSIAKKISRKILGKKKYFEQLESDEKKILVTLLSEKNFN